MLKNGIPGCIVENVEVKSVSHTQKASFVSVSHSVWLVRPVTNKHYSAPLTSPSLPLELSKYSHSIPFLEFGIERCLVAGLRFVLIETPAGFLARNRNIPLFDSVIYPYYVIEDPQWGVRMEAMTRTTTPDVRSDDPMMSITREQSNPLPSLIKDI